MMDTYVTKEILDNFQKTVKATVIIIYYIMFQLDLQLVSRCHKLPQPFSNPQSFWITHFNMIAKFCLLFSSNKYFKQLPTDASVHRCQKMYSQGRWMLTAFHPTSNILFLKTWKIWIGWSRRHYSEDIQVFTNQKIQGFSQCETKRIRQ